METSESILSSPKFCQYAQGSCNQDFTNLKNSEAFFIYPSEPVHLSLTFSETVRKLQQHTTEEKYLSWEKLFMGGKLIFCEICKAIRATKVVVSNITTSNFNVLFELGYAIGLQKPILPARDVSYEKQKRLFDEIGIFDTLGYEEFSNSGELVSIIGKNKSFSPPIVHRPEIKSKQPIYYIKSPVETDGSIKLSSVLKKNYFKFRTFDSKETTRVSLHDAFKQTLSSVSVIAHLIDPERTGATIHNARAAFICGMALASGKHVLMLQEGFNEEPIDYRDVVQHYTNPNTIPDIVENILRQTADTMQSIEASEIPLPKGLLEKIDLGDVAAENEIHALSSYFVKTPQFQQTRQGHARLVIGRKGSGKTALFYGVRNQITSKKEKIVLDLKPEGHQFTRFREKVLDELSEGMQLHTLTAFWHYLLLLEITYKLIDYEKRTAYQNPERLASFEELQNVYNKHVKSAGDFSERLMDLVNRIINRFPQKSDHEITSSDITSAVYSGDIKELTQTIVTHSKTIQEVWILFDNIDKGFPTHGLEKVDVLIIRALLEATRRIQRTFEIHKVSSITSVFLRRDVYQLLVDETPDRGKESFVNLDWSDIELVKELLLRRFKYRAPELEGSFEEIWSRLFDPHVFGENSFNYILARSFLRPRDILSFVRKCIQIAVSRKHERVEQDDIKAAEHEYSEDMLNELRYEMRDVLPNLDEPILFFIGSEQNLSKDDIEIILDDTESEPSDLPRIIEMLLWFSFIGVKIKDDELYAYKFLYNYEKLKSYIKESKSSDVVYCIHPAFRVALGTN
ncbi:MAG: hypothetical protein KJO12_01370 [Ignavibacteria bacterium]|nr:hypothetical protein [Ignavibacteria bacterium]